MEFLKNGVLKSAGEITPEVLWEMHAKLIDHHMSAYKKLISIPENPGAPEVPIYMVRIIIIYLQKHINDVMETAAPIPANASWLNGSCKSLAALCIFRVLQQSTSSSS